MSELGRRTGIAKAELEIFINVWRHSYLTFEQKFSFPEVWWNPRLFTVSRHVVSLWQTSDGLTAFKPSVAAVVTHQPGVLFTLSHADVLRRSGYRAASKLRLGLEQAATHLLGRGVAKLGKQRAAVLLLGAWMFGTRDFYVHPLRGAPTQRVCANSFGNSGTPSWRTSAAAAFAEDPVS